jgi:hypothetical protein
MTDPKSQSITRLITRKIPGGKLVQMEITFSDHIENVKLMGDFFLHPEETLEDLVNAIRITSLPFDPFFLTACLDQILIDHEAQLIGASTEEITSMLEEALSCKPTA